jgi:hypothetical protein
MMRSGSLVGLNTRKVLASQVSRFVMHTGYLQLASVRDAATIPCAGDAQGKYVEHV